MTALARLHRAFPERAVEWGLGYIMVSWGLMVLLNPGIFSSSSAYNGWATMATEGTWGTVALSAGLIRLGALYVNGAHYRTPAVRVGTSFVSMFIWFWIVIGLLVGPPSTGLAVYPWLMVGDGFSVYRAAGDAYEASFRHKKEGNGIGRN